MGFLFVHLTPTLWLCSWTSFQHLLHFTLVILWSAVTPTAQLSCLAYQCIQACKKNRCVTIFCRVCMQSIRWENVRKKTKSGCGREWDRQIDRLAGRQRSRLTNKQMGRQKNRQTNTKKQGLAGLCWCQDLDVSDTQYFGLSPFWGVQQRHLYSAVCQHGQRSGLWMLEEMTRDWDVSGYNCNVAVLNSSQTNRQTDREADW